MDRIKKIKIKQQDGTMSDYYPIGADASNVDIDYNNSTLEVTMKKTPRYYENVASMKLDDTLQEGDMAITLGYYTANDGGGAEYKIVSGNYNDDGGSYHELENNLFAELIINNLVYPEQFGAHGDNLNDDTLRIQTCIDFASTNNITIILQHIYKISPCQERTGNMYNCFHCKSNLHIEGINWNTGFIVDDTLGSANYRSVFGEYTGTEESIFENMSFKNFFIDQNPQRLAKMTWNTGNTRFIFGFYSTLINCEITNILFKNIHGINSIFIVDSESSFIHIHNNEFYFKNIVSGDITSYDCSVLYLGCKNYTVINNKIEGDNYSCVGGLEMHGYNGIAENNTIKYFHDCINIAPGYNQRANIKILNNTLMGYDGIVLWNNNDEEAIAGAADIKIINNHIEIDCNRTSESSMSFAGICLSDSSFNHPIEDLIISNNTITFINLTDIEQKTISLPYSGGINLNSAFPNYLNINILGNIIINSPASGIFIGTTNSSKEIELININIKNNIIKNNGYSGTNKGYKGGITLGYRNFKNIVIASNIIDSNNDIYGIYINTFNSTISEECYLINNILNCPNASTSSLVYDYNKKFIKYDINKITLKSPNNTLYFLSVNDNGDIITNTY